MLHLRIGICDDEDAYLQDITSRLDQYTIKYDIDISYKAYTSGIELLNHLKTGSTNYDVLFLDMEMPEIDGISLADRIREIRRNILIVFISNYPKYMQDSFCVHPFYYLVKPLSDVTFLKTMKDIIFTLENEHKHVTLLHTDNTERMIDIKDILYIDVADAKKGLLRFHFFNHSLVAKGKVSDWEAKLSDYDFFPCHRGILINLAHIHYFERNTAIMDNSDKVPLSRGNEKKLKTLYANNIVRLKNL